MNRRKYLTCATTLLTVVACLSTPDSLPAQIPQEFKNLQLFPRDIASQDLINSMRQFSFALNVRCQHCHAGGDGVSFEGVDFSSDEKAAKRTARQMIRMVRDINEKYISQVQSSRPARAEVKCATCHHGQSIPRGLRDVLIEEFTARGLNPMIDKYRELRRRYYGSDSFDFTENTLTELARELMAKAGTEGTVAIMKLNAEYFPNSRMIPFSMGRLYEEAGDKAKAIESYRKALELDPNFDAAKQRLAALQKN